MNANLTTVVVAVMLVATVATPVTADTDAEPSLTVALSEDGSATVLLTLTYDLGSDAERDAFRSLERDADTRKQVRERFRDRMANVAATAENASGREMSVEAAAIDVRTTPDNETGVVELSVTWNGLAAVEGDRLVVTQPFASGFETDRTVALVAPEGYELADATPKPSAVSDGRVTWKPGTNFAGFEATFRPESAETQKATDDAGQETTTSGTSEQESGEHSTSTGEVPGFGVGIGLASILGAVLVWLRR